MPANFGTILLLFTYLLTSFQVVIQVHTCEVSGATLQVYGAEPPTCCAPSAKPMSCHAEHAHCEPQSSGCCETEQIDLRLELPQQVAKVFALQIAQPVALAQTLSPLLASDDPLAIETRFVDPPPPKVGLWRQYCASLTYG